MNWLSTCDMFSVKSVIIFIVLSVACGCEGRKLYEDSQNDEDDSMDCSDGRKIDDPILLPFLQKFRGQEMLPARMKEWVIYFDYKDASDMFEGWSKSYLTELGLNTEDQGVPYGSVYVNEGTNVYLPRLPPIQDKWNEFRVMYAEQLLLDAIDKVKIYVKYDPQMGEISKSSKRLLQVLLKRARPQTIAVFSSSCNDSCRPDTLNPLITLASCGYVGDKKYEIMCEAPAESFPFDFFEGMETSHFERSITPEYQVEPPVQLKQELQNILDWLLKRIGQRMRNYMEMAFKKNKFRKTNMELYNKVNLQINKIKGGRSFEAAKSADLIYNSLFDLNVYLNVTNTPYTFDKFHTFNLYLSYIGQFSKWRLDTTKYANFFEPLKELCLSQISVGSNLLKPAKKIFELEEGVYDLTGVICHDNVLYVINGMTTINNIKSGLFDNENCDFDTVFVLAKKNLTINEDLKIPGKNLVIFAPTWIIFNERVIDLSGRNGESGEEVESGQSGGDFFGFGLRFDRPDFLTFVTNGGDGGKGRDATAVVSDDRFTSEDGRKCIIKRDKVKEILAVHGATRGGLGGTAGAVSLKILRNPVQNYTAVRKGGKDGKDGKLHDITFQCRNNEQVTLPVHTLTEINVPGNDIQRMDETSILELFRKVIRKNSKRLSYDVLSFYKDIWTSPIIGETLDSTLKDFLNSSDYTESSKDFYEVTSQILHTQIKQTCNMTETQKTLVDLALATIGMTAPAENALPSVIDITSYLKEVSNSVGQKDIEDEYFERKDEKFRKIIEEANYYLKASLLPSLYRSIAETHRYLKDNADEYLVQGNLSEGRKFQEKLVSNSLLRYLTEILKHVQQSLEDFVRKEEYDPAFGTSVGQSDEEKLEKKLYFYRYLRNNVTVNEMNAMSEFIRLLKKMVEEESPTNEDTCQGCRKELDYLIKELKTTLRKSPDKCEKCLNAIEGAKKHHDKRSVPPDEGCDECDGDCTVCGWCDFCQKQCDSCASCGDCPWCPYCLGKTTESCSDEYNCFECPNSPWCGAQPLHPQCGDGVDCSEAPYCPQCSGDDTCSKCNNCYRCPQCPKCDDDECTTCTNCDECPDCPDCQDLCKFCQDCEQCPDCPQCRIISLSECDSCTNCRNCPYCPQCCESCTDCKICPECYKCNNYIPPSACVSCSDCSLCPECTKCFRDACDTCADCRQCPECPMCSQRADECRDCACDECPFCPTCRRGPFDEIDPPPFWCKNNIRKLSELARILGTSKCEGLDERMYDACDTCPCEMCPWCPTCRRGDFDEIDPPPFWYRNNLEKLSELARKIETTKGQGLDEHIYDACETCPCKECPFCPKCRTRNFDEIEAGLFWTRNNLDKLSEKARNSNTGSLQRLYKDNVDICVTCADCQQCPECPLCSQRADECRDCACDECPFCPTCRRGPFDEIDPPPFWCRNNIRKLSELARILGTSKCEGLDERMYDACDTCPCEMCPWCPTCRRGDFDEIDPPPFWYRNNLEKLSELARKIETTKGQGLDEHIYDACETCPCKECPFCPKCRTRNFDEIEAGLFWTRNNLDKLSEKARNSDTGNLERLYKDNMDICDICADCRQCPECPMCSQRADECRDCACDECPFCPKCRTRNFDEIEAGLFWTRNNLDKLYEKTRNPETGSLERLYKDNMDICDICADCRQCPECPMCSQRADECRDCACDECPFCPKCRTRNFDEIEAGLFWTRNNLDKLSEKARNPETGSLDRLYKDNMDICDTCADCRQCPECPMCSQRADECRDCACDVCPFCPSCRRGPFDEIDPPPFWCKNNIRKLSELARILGTSKCEGLDERMYDACGTCPCKECPFCPKCRTRNFDEIEAGLFWTRNNLDKLSEKARNSDTGSLDRLYKDNMDICDTCADCRQCPECPMCSQRADECRDCACDVCPFCPTCRRGPFDEIDPPPFWCRNNIRKLSELARILGTSKCEGLDERMYDACDTCPCEMCPWCPTCRRGDFDEIDPPPFWYRNNLEKLSELARKMENTKGQGLDERMYDACETCPCKECPFCLKCRTRNFDEIEAGLFWTRDNMDKLSEKARNSNTGSLQRLYKDNVDICVTCADCQQCPECPLCSQRADECRDCACDECPFCPKCRIRNFDKMNSVPFLRRKNLKNVRSVGLSNDQNYSKINEAPGPSYSNSNNLNNSELYKQSSFNGKPTKSKSYENRDEGSCNLKNEDECLELPNSLAGVCLDCIRNVENYVREVSSLFPGHGQHCDTEAEKSCKDAVNIVRRIMLRLGNPSGNSSGTGYDSLLLKCSDCNDTLDFFTDKLAAEISRCALEANYNYREVDSKCTSNEGIIFHMKGCDPETFSRTFDEIRENFLKEFSEFVKVDHEHSHQLDHIQSNFGYLLTNIDMLLQEGITLSGATLNNVLYVTDALIKFKDLKMEYQKRMTELHDFSETDMYDLFSSELSMQNERLGMTSKWLNQLKKLLPWMRKVIQFLGANPKFQEVNERIREAIRLVSEIGPNVKLVERHRELRNYINRVKVIEKKEKTTGIGQAILDLKTSFKNTFIKDVFHKAVTMAQNWVFPLTKSFLAIQKIQGKTYDSHLAAVSAAVEEYKKYIMLYTTLHAFDPTKNDVPFYEWNVRTRPTLLHDLFNGKPVILVSEILDGGKKNSLMAKDFEVRFVAGQRQTPGTQEEIDDALKGFWLNLTHSGISYFKFGSRIYRRLTETFTFRHLASTVGREKVKSVDDYVLSPYTTWVLRLEPDSRGEYPAQIQDKIESIQLVGTGRYVINCADIPDVNQYFTPLNDYSRRNEK